jgi:hypothetical protein
VVIVHWEVPDGSVRSESVGRRTVGNYLDKVWYLRLGEVPVLDLDSGVIEKKSME